MYKEKKDILFVAIVSLALTLLTFFRTDLMTLEHPDFTKPWDQHKYIYMAEHPFELKIAPFCWRLLNPVIAALLPFSLLTNFLIITSFALWFSGIAIFLLFKKFGFQFEMSLIGTLLFYSNPWITKSSLHLFWYPDAFVILCIILLIYFIIANKYYAYAIALVFGVLLKESIIFVAPLFYSLKAKTIFDKPLFLASLKYSMPAIIILFSIRMIIPANNSDVEYVRSLPEVVSNIHKLDQSTEIEAGILSQKLVIDPVRYDYKYMFDTFAQYRINNFSFVQFREMTVRTFGWLTIISIFWSFKKNIILLPRVIPLLLLSYLQIFFALNTHRLIIIALPILLLLSLNGIQNAIDKYKIRIFYFYAVVFTTIILNLYTTLPIPYQYGLLWFTVSIAISLYITYRNFMTTKQAASL